MKIRHRFLWSLTGLLLAFALVLATHAIDRTQAAVDDLSRARLRAEADLLAASLSRATPPDPHQLAIDIGQWLDLRVTLIDATGAVLGDSSMDRHGLAALDNHANRPEILQAGSSGSGENLRHSSATGVDYLYVARRVDGGGTVRFVRLAAPPARLSELPQGFVVSLLAVFLAAFLLLGTLAYFLVRGPFRALEEMRAAATRIADGDRDATIPYAGGDELGQLAAEMNRMKRAMAAEINALQVERRRTASVIAGMQEGLLVVDGDRKIRFANAAFARIFRQDLEPEGRLLAEVIRAPALLRDLDAALEQGREVHDSTFRSPDSGLAFQVHVTPLRDGEGNGAPGALILFFDITRLEALENVRRDFVANVSHELRTPLTSIKAFVETLFEDRMEDRQASLEFLGIVRKHTVRMEELIDDLTDLSLIETGAIQLDVQEVDAHRLAREIAAQISHRHADAGVTIDVDLADPFPMRADRRRLEQILSNLLDNAVKFSRAGGRVRVGGTADGDRITLRVADEGVGIPSDSLEKIFHRFYRVDKARSRDVGGTGLGLAIVKHLMRLHGGSIRVQSDLGRGSTFVLEFPLAAAP